MDVYNTLQMTAEEISVYLATAQRRWEHEQQDLAQREERAFLPYMQRMKLKTYP